MPHERGIASNKTMKKKKILFIASTVFFLLFPLLLKVGLEDWMIQKRKRKDEERMMERMTTKKHDRVQ